MDVSYDTSQADDHNTNQNEATLACVSVHGLDSLSNIPKVTEKFNQLEIERTTAISDNKANAGTCDTHPVPVTQNTTETVSTDADNGNDPEKQATTPTKLLDCFTNENEVTPSSEPTADESMNLMTCSTCLKTPPDRKIPNLSNLSTGSGNDGSLVDISVTSDDDIKVTCRCSSTPVNFNNRKPLNEADCSVSSVGDASPISPNEAESKMSTNTQPYDTPECENTRKDRDRIDNPMMYIQPQQYPGKQNEMRNQLMGQEYSPRCSSPYYMDRNHSPGFQQNYPNHSVRAYSAPPYDYPPFLENSCAYNDYHSYGQMAPTDTKSRHDLQSMTVSPQPDICCFPVPYNSIPERDYFVYPSIYVSNAGLISVLLRNDMSVEMTVDRTIRVVSHNHMMAVATDSKGTAATLYHPAVKISQMGYNTDIATDSFRAKMSQGEAIFFSNGVNCYKLQESELQPMGPIKFSDISRDQSVNLLFSSEGYGESLVATCMQVAAQAEYANLPKGGVIVRINGVKVTQSGCGDVTVVTGAKFIRLSPHNGTTRLGNRFVDIEVERDWSVKLTRGTYTYVSTKKRTMLSNGKMEAGFDENNGLKVINLQPRHPLLTDPSIIRRNGKRLTRTPPPASVSTSYTPRRRVVVSGLGRGGINSC